MEKKLYAIYHDVDEDGGFGDAIWTENMIGLAWATEDEMEAYLKKWDKPEVYDIPYAELTCHAVRVEQVAVMDDISLIEPYSTDPDDYYNRMIARAKEKIKQIEKLNKKEAE